MQKVAFWQLFDVRIIMPVCYRGSTAGQMPREARFRFQPHQDACRQGVAQRMSQNSQRVEGGLGNSIWRKPCRSFQVGPSFPLPLYEPDFHKIFFRVKMMFFASGPGGNNADFRHRNKKALLLQTDTEKPCFFRGVNERWLHGYW